MAVRYTVYCRHAVASVGPSDLLRGVKEADLLTMAENDDVPDDIAEAAVANLAVLDMEPDSPFSFCRLVYRPGDVRQIDIHRWPTAEDTRVDLTEVLEDLEPEAASQPLLPRIRQHFDGVVDVVSASFGSAPEEAMAPVLVSEVARWLAEQFDGIIRAADDTWWELGSVGEYVRMEP